jgi:hypothetical protein
MVQNTQQLFEALLMLNHHNALSSLDEVKAAVTQRILAEKRMFEKKAAETKVDQATKKDAAPAGMEKVIVKTAAEPTSEEKKAGNPKKLSGGVNATLFEGSHSLANKFENEETLHKHIAAKAPGETVAENLFRKPIKDLKSAIGINEKFLFINQLFDGNLQDYSEVIEKLNNAGSLDTAKQMLSADLARRFNWETGDPHVRSFTELVERRFIS